MYEAGNAMHRSRCNKKTMQELRGKENANLDVMHTNKQKENKERIKELLSRINKENSNIERVIDKLNQS